MHDGEEMVEGLSKAAGTIHVVYSSQWSICEAPMTAIIMHLSLTAVLTMM